MCYPSQTVCVYVDMCVMYTNTYVIEMLITSDWRVL